MKVVKVPRGVGLWGDMVLTLKNGSRLEIRAIPNFREVYEYINDRLPLRILNILLTPLDLPIIL